MVLIVDLSACAYRTATRTFLPAHTNTHMVSVSGSCLRISISETRHLESWVYLLSECGNCGSACVATFDVARLYNAVLKGNCFVMSRSAEGSFFCVNDFFDALETHRGGHAPLPPRYNTSETVSLLGFLDDIAPVSPSVDDASVAQLYFCCHMDEYADIVR